MHSSILVAAFTVIALGACYSGSDSDEPDFPPLVTNLELAVGQVEGSGIRLRLVTASEAGEGRDADGDGDTEDFVVQILELFPGTFVNTGLALDPPSPFLNVIPPEIDSSDALGVFVVNERATGRDANANGVPNERTTWVFDRRLGSLRALPFAHQSVALDGELAAFWVPTDPPSIHVLDARDGSLTTLPDTGVNLLLVRDERVVFFRSEQDSVDLNGDGDTDDRAVLQLYDARTRAVVNTGWATYEARWVSGWLGFLVDEREQGDLDLDGEAGPGFAFVLLDPDTGEVRIPRVASTSFASLAQAFVLLQDEQLLGDRNGDGDAVDSVPLVYDPHRDVTIAPGIAAFPEVAQAEHWFGLSADQGEELIALHVPTGAIQRLGLAGYWIGGVSDHLLAARPERGADLNGDGDENDWVLFDWNERTPAGRNVGLAVGGFHGACFGQALVTLIEFSQGRDANGDGDREDLVLTVYDARNGAVHGLGLGVDGVTPLSDFGTAPVMVSEPAQGVDLNGDGDMLDAVLHKVQVVQRID